MDPAGPVILGYPAAMVVSAVKASLKRRPSVLQVARDLEVDGDLIAALFADLADAGVASLLRHDPRNGDDEAHERLTALSRHSPGRRLTRGKALAMVDDVRAGLAAARDAGVLPIEPVALWLVGSLCEPSRLTLERVTVAVDWDWGFVPGRDRSGGDPDPRERRLRAWAMDVLPTRWPRGDTDVVEQAAFMVATGRRRIDRLECIGGRVLADRGVPCSLVWERGRIVAPVRRRCHPAARGWAPAVLEDPLDVVRGPATPLDPSGIRPPAAAVPRSSAGPRPRIGVAWPSSVLDGTSRSSDLTVSDEEWDPASFSWRSSSEDARWRVDASLREDADGPRVLRLGAVRIDPRGGPSPRDDAALAHVLGAIAAIETVRSVVAGRLCEVVGTFADGTFADVDAVRAAIAPETLAARALLAIGSSGPAPAPSPTAARSAPASGIPRRPVERCAPDDAVVRLLLSCRHVEAGVAAAIALDGSSPRLALRLAAGELARGPDGGAGWCSMMVKSIVGCVVPDAANGDGSAVLPRALKGGLLVDEVARTARGPVTLVFDPDRLVRRAGRRGRHERQAVGYVLARTRGWFPRGARASAATSPWTLADLLGGERIALDFVDGRSAALGAAAASAMLRASVSAGCTDPSGSPFCVPACMVDDPRLGVAALRAAAADGALRILGDAVELGPEDPDEPMMSAREERVLEIALADIRLRLIYRLRGSMPVLVLAPVPDDGFDADAADVRSLATVEMLRALVACVPAPHSDFDFPDAGPHLPLWTRLSWPAVTGFEPEDDGLSAPFRTVSAHVLSTSPVIRVVDVATRSGGIVLSPVASPSATLRAAERRRALGLLRGLSAASGTPWEVRDALAMLIGPP